MELTDLVPTSGAVPRHSNRRVAIRIALALGLTFVLAASWLWFRTTPGPLGVSAGWRSTTGIPVSVSGRLSVGVQSPTNRSSDTLVIDSIQPDSVPSGLRVLGDEVIPLGQVGIGSARSFPPSGYHGLSPVNGWLVRPGEGFAVVVGLQPVQAGRFVIPGFTVRYHAGGRSYAAHYFQAVLVCASPAGPNGKCSTGAASSG